MDQKKIERELSMNLDKLVEQDNLLRREHWISIRKKENFNDENEFYDTEWKWFLFHKKEKEYVIGGQVLNRKGILSAIQKYRGHVYTTYITIKT